MIYFFGGDNKSLSLEKANKLFESLRVKKPDAAFVSTEGSNITLDTIDEFISSQGLFEKKMVVFLKDIFENKDIKKEILSRIKEFKDSQNIFVWVESDISAKEEENISKYAEKVLISNSKVEKKEVFNTFALADAFGNRDKKKLWTLFQGALKRGISAEEIHGIIFWQAKAIVLATKSSATDSGLKPFVYSKAKSFSKKFSENEIDEVLKKLVLMYHEAHKGTFDFNLKLEEFFLSL